MTAFDTEAVDVFAEKVEKEAPKRRRRGEPAIQISLFLIGALVALPIVVAIFTSVTPLSDILRDPNSVWSPPWTFDNFNRITTA